MTKHSNDNFLYYLVNYFQILVKYIVLCHQNCKWGTISVAAVTYLYYVLFYIVACSYNFLLAWNLAHTLCCCRIFSFFLCSSSQHILVTLQPRCCFPVVDKHGSQQERILNCMHRKFYGRWTEDFFTSL